MDPFGPLHCLDIRMETPLDLASLLDAWYTVGKCLLCTLGMLSVLKWVSWISAIWVLDFSKEESNCECFSGMLRPCVLIEQSLSCASSWALPCGVLGEATSSAMNGWLWGLEGSQVGESGISCVEYRLKSGVVNTTGLPMRRWELYPPASISGGISNVQSGNSVHTAIGGTAPCSTTVWMLAST